MKPKEIHNAAKQGTLSPSIPQEWASRLGRDDLEFLAARLADLLAADARGACVPDTVPSAIQEAGAADNHLLTVDELLAARPGLSRSWLYRNAGDCGAIQKNKSKRSPLWFRLRDVDAELDRRRKAPVPEVVEPLEMREVRRTRSRRARCAADDGAFTADGYPRRFQISPRRAA